MSAEACFSLMTKEKIRFFENNTKKFCLKYGITTIENK